jgi:Heterogeneous nuclear ribonucleoprotein Q acidic domain
MFCDCVCPVVLQAKLDRLYDNGVLRKGDIDSYTYDALEALSSDLADCAMNRFCEANFSRITNKSGFLMGIIRRVQVDASQRNVPLCSFFVLTLLFFRLFYLLRMCLCQLRSIFRVLSRFTRSFCGFPTVAHGAAGGWS